jgi:hypothetical protein
LMKFEFTIIYVSLGQIYLKFNQPSKPELVEKDMDRFVVTQKVQAVRSFTYSYMYI